MPASRPEEFARHFPENGMKLLLQEPLNVRDLLRLLGWDRIDLIDFSRLQADPTVHIQRDYRHTESDLVLYAPLRGHKRGLLLYILLEHQSEPDPLMVFRVLEYTVLIYRSQAREWRNQHPSYSGFQFQAVLPIVLYTGTDSWPNLGTFATLLADERLKDLAPVLPIQFLNLPEMPAERLEMGGGAFGQLLRLYQARRRPVGEFRSLLHAVVESLEALPEAELSRWQSCLSYIVALVYHEREEPERGPLTERIEKAVRSKTRTAEVRQMGQTIAERLREEGRQEGLLMMGRQTVLRLIRAQFGKPSKAMVAAVEACDDLEQLNAWILGVVSAQSLDDLGILPPK